MIRSLTSPRIALGALLLVGACHVRLDASHCFNNGANAQERNELCDLRYGMDGLGVCSPCAATNDGCVDTPPEPGECPRYDDEVDTAAGSSVGTTEGPGATSMVATGAMTTTDPMTTDPGTTDPGTTGGPEPYCGDGVKNGDEKCDGDDLGGMTCDSFVTGDDGTLACASNCEYDFSLCEGVTGCGNGTIEGAEECDGNNLGGATCASVSDYDRGTLECAKNCKFNTTDCCYSNGEQCSGDGQCCSGNCDGILEVLVTPTCKP